MQVTLSSDRIVLDFDKAGAMDQWAGGPPTLYVDTRRGRHYHYRLQTPIPYSTAFWGGDILGPDHQITVPPSTHRSGHKYAQHGADIAEVECLEELGIELPPKIQEEGQGGRGTKGRKRILLPTDISYGNGISPIQRLKQDISMSDLLGRFGIEVKDGRCLCPFHDDHSPSMGVKRHTAKCFVPGCAGSRARNIIDMAMYLYGSATVSDVIERLRGA